MQRPRKRGAMPVNPASSRSGAVAFAAAGIALLCFMDAVIKHLVATNDTLVVVFGRYLFASIFAAVIWLKARRPAITPEMWRAHGLRAVVISACAVAFFWSLTALPLVEVVVISFLAPLLMPFTARLMLGERIRPRNVGAGLAGFAGVIVASVGAPAEAAIQTRLLGIAAVLFAAVTYAISMTMLRGRAGKDGPEIAGLLAALLPGAIVSGPAIVTGGLPPASDIPAFIALGLFAAGGMYFFAKAYASAETQVLAPLEYTALIWAAGIGWFLFAEPVRPQVWAGAALIIAACLWGAREEKALSQAGSAAA
ncbi:MAG TPA: EamA/RhaT family transporter [Parvularcula sp.]|nr:EamA/RhaT family transporter [Parvularcula sp.]HBS32276.1 EamA/RhaT family transporter [Parvularcula sp.]